MLQKYEPGFTPLEILAGKGKQYGNQKFLTGFTIIELLVVIAIIGLLSSVVLTISKSARVKARDKQRQANLIQLRTALEFYYDDKGGYPATPSNVFWGEIARYGGHALTGANGWIPNLAPQYVAQLPHDPATFTQNPVIPGCPNYESSFLYASNGRDYKLLANCLPETFLLSSNQFYDPPRPTWAWQVSTPGARLW